MIFTEETESVWPGYSSKFFIDNDEEEYTRDVWISYKTLSTQTQCIVSSDNWPNIGNYKEIKILNADCMLHTSNFPESGRAILILVISGLLC